ncbi:RloB family protein [Sphaerisporangium rhizosphaerae]|uniref:RloB family protein n=1 Tax=Sphaerisporangium rhizosphaerae TaxID=2269375 RepID=A0ABW2NX83_9ACTN
MVLSRSSMTISLPRLWQRVGKGTMVPRERKTGKVSTETDLKRNRRGVRTERSSFLILCEGKTEKDYFTGMRSRHGPNLAVNIPKGGHRAVVREAAKCVSDEYDAVWCVVDTELDQSLTREMVRAAENCEVRLALSTPCFELWLLLHHVDHGKPFQSAESAKKLLKDVVPTWSEGATKYADFAHGVETACRRARKLHPDDDDPLKNPSTSVWRLVESLRCGAASK